MQTQFRYIILKIIIIIWIDSEKKQNMYLNYFVNYFQSGFKKYLGEFWNVE